MTKYHYHHPPSGGVFTTARRANELADIMRSGEATKQEMMAVAGVLDAYSHLLSYCMGITCVVRQLRVLFRMERALPPEPEDEE